MNISGFAGHAVFEVTAHLAVVVPKQPLAIHKQMGGGGLDLAAVIVCQLSSRLLEIEGI